MKTKITVARSGDLASGTVEIKHPAFEPAVQEPRPHSGSERTVSDNFFRELQNRHYTTPFAIDHWGLNE